MGSSSKSGSSQNQKNYYATLAGAICRGPIDWISGVVANGNYIWQSSGGVPMNLTADVTDLTGSLEDSTVIGDGGYLKIYRGTGTQPVDSALAALADHPPYYDLAYIVAKHIFFGQNSGTAPNIQVIAGRIPRVDTSIVAAVDNVANDYQVNPIAAVAEWLLDDQGLGLPLSMLDSTSWLASAHWCAQDQAHMDYSFCSPLVKDQSAIRDSIKRILDPLGIYLYWTPAGTLGCRVYEYGLDPGGLTTFDANSWVKDPKFIDGDWTDIPTELLVSFTNRDYEYQQDSVIATNYRARMIRQVDDQQRINRDHVTRSSQAMSHGVKQNSITGGAPGTGTLVFRGPVIGTLLPGDKIKVNVEPEPGDTTGISHLCRVEKVTQDTTDSTTVDVTTDPLSSSTPYAPAWPTPTVSAETVAPIQYQTAIPLPTGTWGAPLSIGLLTTRGAGNLVGFEVFLGAASAGSFADLGLQTTWAARNALYAAIGNAATTVRLQLLDGASGPDALLASQTPSGNVAETADNYLLAIIAQVDANGKVSLDSAGSPILEFISISSRTPASGSGVDPTTTFDYTVLRGRCGVPARNWNITGGLVTTTTDGLANACWILPFTNIVPWRHNYIQSYIGSTLYVRTVSRTLRAIDESTPIPETSIAIPADFSGFIPSTPTGLSATNSAYVQADGTVVPDVLLNWTAAPDANVSDGGQVWVEYKKSSDSTFITWENVPGTQASSAITGIASGVNYDFRIRFQNASGAYGAYETITGFAVGGSNTAPSVPTGFTATALTQAIKLKWTPPANTDLIGYDIYELATATPAPSSGTTPTWTIGLVNTWTRDGLGGGQLEYYWIRSRNTSGLTSAWVGPQSATTLYGVDPATVAAIQASLTAQIAQEASDAASLNALATANANAITTETSSRTSADSGLQSQITTLNSTVSGVSSSLATEASTRASADSALSSTITSLSSSLSTTNANLSTESSTRATADSALSSTISSLSSTVSGMSSSVTLLASAYIYGGQTVAAWGFQLNTGGQVSGAQAIAATGGGWSTVSVLQFTGLTLQTAGFTAGSGSGWSLDPAGNLTANNGLFYGTIKASTLWYDCVLAAGASGSGQSAVLEWQHSSGSGGWQTDINDSDHTFRVYNQSTAGYNFQVGLGYRSSNCYVNGDLSYTGALTHVSTRNFKSNIKGFSGGLAQLRLLKPSRFTWNDSAPLMLQNKDDFGLIAEDVQSVVPEAFGSVLVPSNLPPAPKMKPGEKVRQAEPPNIKAAAVDYVKLITVLIAAVQELDAKVSAINPTHN